MPQPFVITGNIEFSGDRTLIKVQERDRPFWLTCDMDMQVIAHQFIRSAIAPSG